MKVEKEKFEELKKILVEGFNYKQTKNANCLISPNKLEVDLLSFSEVESLELPNFDGLKEVFEKEIKEVDIEGDKFKICSTVALVLLKLIAFDDRPEYRQKDPSDINSILRDYPELEIELIYEKYSDLFDDGREIEMEQIGIEALGREIGTIIKESPELSKRVLEILDKAIKNPTTYRLSSLMIEKPEEETLEHKIDYLRYLRKGIMSYLEM